MKKFLIALLLILTFTIPAIAETTLYGPTNPMGGTRVYGVTNDDIVYAINSIVSNPSNIKGMWFFDVTAGSTIKDRSGNGHDITLRNNSLVAINASTCSPGVSGLSPYLTFDATHVWNAADHDDFSLTDGAGNDIAGSFIFAGNMVDMTGSNLFSKYTTTDNNCEYIIRFGGADKLEAYFGHGDFVKYIGRYYNTALTAYQNTFVTVIVTYDGSEASTGIKIYFLGSQVDDTTGEALAYTGMSNGTSPPTSYYASPALARFLKGKASFQAFIKGEAITQTQVTNWDRLLRSYAGVAL
jgi:hypothetical protein